MENEKGVDVDTEPVVMEVLPDIELSFSPSFAKLVEALAKAQLAYKPVLKQNENEAFSRGNRRSFYADLATYIDATQEALANNGLVVIQWPTVAPESKSMTLISILAHSSGEFMRGKLTLPAVSREGFTAQSCGSSITYARRYAYGAITGCAAEDDDGNAASGRGTQAAANAVAEEKIENAKGKKPSLFWAWEDASQTATIVGDQNLKTANKDLLAPLWSATAGQLVANAQQLEDLKYSLEQRKVPFVQLKTGKANA